MANFIYKARDESGKLISGIIEAQATADVIQSLKERGYLPVSIKPAQNQFLFLRSFKKGVSLSEINVFSRQLSVLLKAGLPLLGAIYAIKEQTQNTAFKEVLGDLIRYIERGSFFSEALSKHESLFGKIYVNMVKTAEAGGMLDEILERLAMLGEREEDIRAQIKSATLYPMIVVFTLVVAFVVLIFKVIPRFTQIFSQSEVQLPLPTQIMIGLSNFFSSFWYLAIGIVILSIFGFRIFKNTPQGRILWDRIKISFPVFGVLNLKIMLSRFSRIVSILTRSGVPIVKVLDLAKESVGNVIVRRTIERIVNKVTQGESVSRSMRESGLFPSMIVQMVAAGEGSGRLDELLMFVSDYYDSQIKYALKNLVTYIEPALIFVLSSSVLFIALAVFLPMWNLIQLFKR